MALTIQMLYFQNTGNEIQKLATYATKSFELMVWVGSHPRYCPGAVPMDSDGAQPHTPIIFLRHI